MTLINSQNSQELRNADNKNLAKKFSVLAVSTLALAFQTLPLPAIAKTHEYTNPVGSNLLASNAAYRACTLFQSRNPSVGQLISYRDLGWGVSGCDYRGGCYRVTFWGTQASVLINSSFQLAKTDPKASLQTTTN
jgi:hypothetical protein